METYTINKVSKLTNLAVKTIRFYENSGLVTKTSRADNGYRLFTKESVEQLKLIKYARDLDLPLSEIKKLLLGCQDSNCNHSREHMEAYVDNYLDLLSLKIHQFQILKQKLKNLKTDIICGPQNCQTDVYCCNILQQLVTTDSMKGGEQ